MRVAQGGGGLRKSGAPRVCLTEGCGVQVRGERTCRTCYQKARYTANEAKIRAKRKGHGNDRTRGTRAALQSIVSLTMSTVRRNEARLNQLEAFLGIHVPALQQDVRSIQLVLDELARPVEGDRVVDPGYLHYWSGVFFGVNDAYLKSVGALMNTKEPWKPFLDFANSVSRTWHQVGAEALKSSEELEFAEKCYRSACLHLWCMAHRAATGASEKGSPVEEIYELIAHGPRILAQMPGINRRAARKRGSKSKTPRAGGHEELGQRTKRIEPMSGDVDGARSLFDEETGEGGGNDVQD